jgi:hypothetical protein
MTCNGVVTERNWAEYFGANRQRRLRIDWDKGVRLDTKHSKAIIASLQRFQVGESGEGNHLKKYAALTGDAEYCRAIELFMGEESYHAQMLARALGALDAPLFKGHWSDVAFIVIRRFSGLEMELMILLVAELIAKRYYRVLHDATGDENLRLMCVQILRDENAHVAFHCDTLSRAFASRPAAQRAWTLFWWKHFYRFVCAVVAWDHRGVLCAAQCPLAAWMRDTRSVFEHAAAQIFAPHMMSDGIELGETSLIAGS